MTSLKRTCHGVKQENSMMIEEKPGSPAKKQIVKYSKYIRQQALQVEEASKTARK